MMYNELFIQNNLPNQFEKTELEIYFKRMYLGDKEAKYEIIRHNIKYVIRIVRSNFFHTLYDEADLVSIGIIGLMKAVDTFQLEKKINFSTYANRCILNEILMFIRKEKKYLSCYSLDHTLVANNEETEIKLMDDLIDEENIEQNYEDKELKKIIRDVIKELPEKEQDIIIKYFGFDTDICLGQTEIANLYGISQSRVSRIIKKTINNIKMKLSERGIVENESKTL